MVVAAISWHYQLNRVKVSAEAWLQKSTMRAAVYREYGKPADVLRLEENYPVPKVGHEDVLVEVHACSINPIDWKKMSGFLAILEQFTGDLEGGSTTGFDFSGKVVGLGRGVTTGRLRVGDGVFGMAFVLTTGACAEYVAVDQSLVSHKPAALTHKEAASIPLAGLTSYQSLVHFGGLQYTSKESESERQKVLLLGASGGTGSLGAQIAKIMGAKVTATCSSRNNDLVKSLGVEQTVDYRVEDVYEAMEGKEFDVLYDCVGGCVFVLARREVISDSLLIHD